MSFSHQISIGPEFFAKAKNDYRSSSWAIIREFMQNSMDCGSDNIEVTIAFAEGHTVLTVTNDGEPMTKDILVNKLLSLGSSGKDFKEGKVGGFGKAKEILYFCHEKYTIKSGVCRVTGRGAGYDLEEVADSFHGTQSQILIKGDYVSALQNEFERFCAFSQWKGKVMLNGHPRIYDLKKGSPRREFTWGTLYTNNSMSNRVVVRIGGIPMFSEYTSYEGCVIIELKGESAGVLTSNRDGLVYKYGDEYQAFLTSLATDKEKALRTDSPSYVHFEGKRFQNAGKGKGIENSTQAGKPSLADIKAMVAAGKAGSLDLSQSLLLKAKTNSLMEEFIVKNETEMAVPEYYMPDSDQFGAYSIKLARIWGKLLLKLHELFNLSGEFAIGFVLSADAIAQYELTGQYGTVYYINPAEIVTQQYSSSKSFRKRWKLTDRGALLATAAHEVVHGMGFRGHDEAYACKYTEVMGVVLANMKSFNDCFK